MHLIELTKFNLDISNQHIKKICRSESVEKEIQIEKLVVSWSVGLSNYLELLWQ